MSLETLLGKITHETLFAWNYMTGKDQYDLSKTISCVAFPGYVAAKTITKSGNFSAYFMGFSLAFCAVTNWHYAQKIKESKYEKLPTADGLSAAVWSSFNAKIYGCLGALNVGLYLIQKTIPVQDGKEFGLFEGICSFLVSFGAYVLTKNYTPPHDKDIITRLSSHVFQNATRATPL